MDADRILLTSRKAPEAESTWSSWLPFGNERSSASHSRFHSPRTIFTEAHGRAAQLVALTTRQRESLRDARDAIERGRELMRGEAELRTCAELVAMELREAIGALSLLTGDITTEDLLGRIFSRFCIGK